MTPESCCNNQETKKRQAFDPIFHGSLGAISIVLLLYAITTYTQISVPYAPVLGGVILELLGRMWWGVALGIFFVGLMGKIPREYFTAMLGRGDTYGGIIRAGIAGLFLDLCSHGILLVGSKLYERGASTAQIMTFLIASPWNSLSLTIILISLIGLKWTLIFVAGSAFIALLAGIMAKILTDLNILPANPHKVEMPKDFALIKNAKADLKDFKLSKSFLTSLAWSGIKESKMIIKWLLFGILIASSIRTFVPMEVFGTWFGPSLIGLGMTLVAATIIEVCSEGSAPIASELFTRAHAPGNSFAFLMAGVSTDYTEIMVIREFTKSWKVALFLPLLTLPQVIILGYVMNMFGG